MFSRSLVVQISSKAAAPAAPAAAAAATSLNHAFDTGLLLFAVNAFRLSLADSVNIGFNTVRLPVLTVLATPECT